MALVEGETLKQIISERGGINAVDAWSVLNDEDPATAAYLRDRAEVGGALQDELGRLLALVALALRASGVIGTAASALDAWIDQLRDRRTDGFDRRKSLTALRNIEPEIAALLAFFIREVDHLATAREIEICCAVLAAMVLATSANAARRTPTAVRIRD